MIKFLFFIFFVCIVNVSFSQVNLNNGLLAYYPFNGNANDASGNGNNSIFNNATLTSDRLGNPNSAYYFNGIDNYIQIPNTPGINTSNQISICALVKPMGFYTGPCHGNSVVMKGDGDYLPGNYAIRFDDNAYTFQNNCNTSVVDIIHQNFYGVNAQTPSPGYTPYINKDQWYCIAYTYDGTLGKFYVDGVLTYTESVPGISFTNSYDLFFGKLNSSAFPYWFNGIMDEVRLYNRAINAQEVNALCSAPVNDSIINNYTEVLGFNICKNELTVADGSKYNPGDTVLLIQMKGAVIDSSNTLNFGTVINYKNAGNYEYNYVKQRTGNVIVLKNLITRQYDIPAGKVQLVRVPYYVNLNTNDKLTCLPWDGSKGGVLAFNIKNTLTMNADIDVTGKGFSGGKTKNTNSLAVNCFTNGAYYPSGSIMAAAKGESIYDLGDDKKLGKAPMATGAGGGSDHNSGGGGGANGGAGGNGGYEVRGCGTDFDNGGRGGRPGIYNNFSNKIFLGGGGGSGHANNSNGINMNGGNGGGIILIKSNSVNSNSYKFLAKGAAGELCDSVLHDCNDGNGGAGGGGVILIDNISYFSNTLADAAGGMGANLTSYNPVYLRDKVGPGGGGGGGIVWLVNTTLPANLITTVGGGANGVIVSANNDPWGATSGQNGLNLFSLKVPVDTVLFKKNIDSVRIKDSATSCSSFNFKGLGYTNASPITTWQWTFGDGGTATIQNTSYSYAAPGAFTVKLVVTDVNGCKDSITRNISLLTTDFDFSYQQDVCNPHLVEFFNAGNNSLNPYWSFGDGNALTGTLNPIHTYPSLRNYIVKFSIQNGGCIDTITKTISLAVIPADIIITPDTTICNDSIKQLRTIPTLSFCWSPVTFLNNPLSPDPITSTTQNITYYFTAKVTGSNAVINGNFNSGNTGFTSEYSYANTNVTEGQYFVGANPQAWNATLSNCGDHTTGKGNMLLVTGAPTADINVWKQTVIVVPNTNYALSTWIQALHPPNTAQLQFSVNGKGMGNLITASLPTCTWTQFFATWNSGNNTSATISIVNKNTIVQRNYFALDDISFSPVFVKRDSVKITINHPFVKTNNDSIVCSGSKIQINTSGASNYAWTPVSGLSNPSVANPLVTVGNTVSYFVTGINKFGCIAKDTVKITALSRPAITKSRDTTICINSSVQIFATGGGTYSWLPVSTLSNADISNPIASPSSTTKYFVTVTNTSLCSSTDSVLIKIKPLTVFSVSPNSSVCVQSTKQLVATGGTSYAWSPPLYLSNANINNPVSTPGASITYTVNIRDSTCNETETLTTIVTALPLPDVQASSSNDLTCSLGSSQLIATGAASYLWTPAAGLNNSSISNPVATPGNTTIYKVIGKNINGCANSAVITVNADYSMKSLYLLPNSFTPNNDGINDCFGIKYWGIVQELDFSIYNRFGEKVFHTNNAGICWDGTYKQKLQDVNVFVYIIKAKTTCGYVERKGIVALLK